MKSILYLLICICLFACSPDKKSISTFEINLNNPSENVRYSQIIKSLEYLVLEGDDSFILSGIKKIYIDKDTIILQDTKREGVFVFTRDGVFQKQINYIGEGPTEYTQTKAVAVDTAANLICIYDIMGFKINKYTYQGEFIESNRLEGVIRDFAMMNNGSILMVMPCYYKNQKSGVWLASSRNQYIKPLLDDVPKDHEFEFLSTFYNQTPSGIYYYDRNDDRLFFITPDSVTPLYQIDLVQRIPANTRKKASPHPSELLHRAMMYDFCFSPACLAFTYFIFGENESPYRWVFVDRETKAVTVCKQFVNDMDSMAADSPNLFYINDSTWCRMVNMEENDSKVILQLLHLK